MNYDLRVSLVSLLSLVFNLLILHHRHGAKMTIACAKM